VLLLISIFLDSSLCDKYSKQYKGIAIRDKTSQKCCRERGGERGVEEFGA
jgi:hypothetical protein